VGSGEEVGDDEIVVGFVISVIVVPGWGDVERAAVLGGRVVVVRIV